MSASERLRALDEAMTTEPWVIHNRSSVYGEAARPWGERVGELNEGDALVTTTLRNALPLIADVVETAEFARNWPEMPSDLRWGDFDAALAALDAALTVTPK